MVESLRTLYRNIRESVLQHRLARKWEKTGKAEPPPHIIKEKTIREYAKRFSTPTLIETGTYLGEMIYVMRKKFRRIISIELDDVLYRRAAERFKKYSHITIVLGDSASVLPQILQNEKTRCLFWLDGHYSGGDTARGKQETPIIDELQHIKISGDNHVILIDDARLFQGANDYPKIETLESSVRGLWPGNVFDVRDDIIRIHPHEGAVIE